MSNTYFCSDFHWGHNNISKYRSYVDSNEHSIELTKELWHNTIRKNDTVWCMGDMLFHSKYAEEFAKLPGQKYLILGNHCFQMSKYDNWQAIQSGAFANIYGICSRKNIWHTHAPIIESELRGKYNVHGHLHVEHVLDKDGNRDPRYFNVNMDIIYPIINNVLINAEVVIACLTSGKTLEEMI